MSRLQLGESNLGLGKYVIWQPDYQADLCRWNMETWKYRNRSEKDTEVGLFLVFSVDIEEERN